MKVKELPTALVAHLPEVEVTQTIAFEGDKMVNTYHIRQDPNSESFSDTGEGLVASEFTLRPLGDKIRIVYNNVLILNFLIPELNTVVTDAPTVAVEVDKEEELQAPAKSNK